MNGKTGIKKILSQMDNVMVVNVGLGVPMKEYFLGPLF